MVKIEKQLNRLLPSAHFDRLAADHGRERGQALLGIKQQTRALVRICLLGDRHLLERHRLVGLPEEHCTRGITAIERVAGPDGMRLGGSSIAYTHFEVPRPTRVLPTTV